MVLERFTVIGSAMGAVCTVGGDTATDGDEMTESEAREKWCPFTNQGTKDMSTVESACLAINCIASDCMAWRKWNVEAPDSADGYCGLAGKP